LPAWGMRVHNRGDHLAYPNFWPVS
jgi:hypothetical protein